MYFYKSLKNNKKGKIEKFSNISFEIKKNFKI